MQRVNILADIKIRQNTLQVEEYSLKPKRYFTITKMAMHKEEYPNHEQKLTVLKGEKYNSTIIEYFNTTF